MRVKIIIIRSINIGNQTDCKFSISFFLSVKNFDLNGWIQQCIGIVYVIAYIPGSFNYL